VSTDPDAPQGPAAGAAAADEPAAPGPGDGPGSGSGGSGPGGGPGPAGPAGQPSEEELRAAYEAELARITSTDMILQAAVSLLNVGSYRLMPAPAAGAEAGAQPPGSGRDLEQVRDAIDGVRALLEILERRVPSEVRPLRDALSQLQMAYAREVQASGAEPAAQSGEGGQGGGQTPPAGAGPGSSGGAPGAPGGPAPGQGPAQGPAPGDQGEPGPGPAESSGRLWVPGR
jgi:hypothetical protein